MKWSQNMIMTSLREIFAYFEGGSSDVKREWRALVAHTDSAIEVGFRYVAQDSGALLFEPILLKLTCEVVFPHTHRAIIEARSTI